jgi:hypothetical protein
VPSGVFPVPSFRPTPSNSVRTRPSLGVRVRPAGGATADEGLARGPDPATSAELSRAPHNSAASSSAPGSPPERLVVTPTTAETRVSRAIVTLHDRDRAQLVLFTYGTGLALPPPNAQTLDRRPLSPGDVVPSPSIAEHLERQSVVPIESTIPTDMTAEQWRRQRSARPGPGRRRSARLFAAGRRLVPLWPVPCDHMQHTTTRYDQVEKLFSFLLVCPVCGTEKLVETQPYAPHFTPHPATRSPAPGATVHRLPVRRRRPPRGRWGAGPMRPSATAIVHRRRTNGQSR